MKPGASTSPRASISRVRAARDPADGHDPVARDADVAREGGRAGAVDDARVADAADRARRMEALLARLSYHTRSPPLRPARGGGCGRGCRAGPAPEGAVEGGELRVAEQERDLGERAGRLRSGSGARARGARPRPATSRPARARRAGAAACGRPGRARARSARARGDRRRRRARPARAPRAATRRSRLAGAGASSR